MTNKLQVEMRSPHALTGYTNNARIHDAEQVQQLINSINEFGFTNPILIDEHDGIIAGHGRFEAAMGMELAEVPCIVLAGLSEAQKRAYIIADNKLAENARWDETLLALELSELQELDIDSQLLGFSPSELNSLFEEPSENFARNVQSPVYEVTGECPAINELYDEKKTKALKRNIKKANIPDDIRRFLNSAAERHTAFNFKNIAEFYAHADEEVQALMEESVLIIIDFDQAVEAGFVQLTNLMNDIHAEEYPDE